VRAIIEGVSYSQMDCLAIIEDMGVPVESVRASGGGGQSAFWRQVLANIFNKPVVALKTHEGSAYGAALLAMTGTGAYSSVPEACQAAVREVSTVSARMHESNKYRGAYEVYKALYPSLRPIYGLIGSL
jgi:xylulokinase